GKERQARGIIGSPVDGVDHHGQLSARQPRQQCRIGRHRLLAHEKCLWHPPFYAGLDDIFGRDISLGDEIYGLALDLDHGRVEPPEARQGFGARRISQDIGQFHYIEGHGAVLLSNRPAKSKSLGSSMWLALILPSARIITSLRPGMRFSISASIVFIALRSSPSWLPHRSQGMMGKAMASEKRCRSSSAQYISGRS